MILVALQIIVSFQDVLGNCRLCCVDCIFLCQLDSFYVNAFFSMFIVSVNIIA